MISAGIQSFIRIMVAFAILGCSMESGAHGFGNNSIKLLGDLDARGITSLVIMRSRNGGSVAVEYVEQCRVRKVSSKPMLIMAISKIYGVPQSIEPNFFEWRYKIIVEASEVMDIRISSISGDRVGGIFFERDGHVFAVESLSEPAVKRLLNWKNCE